MMAKKVALTDVRSAERCTQVATLTFASWNQVGEWLRRLESLRQLA